MMVLAHQSPLPLFGVLLTVLTVTFLIDISLPLGVAAGILSTLVVLCASLLPWTYAPLLGAALASASIVGGYLFSPPSGVSHQTVILNRELSLMAIWAVALGIFLIRRARSDRRAVGAGKNESARWDTHAVAELDHRVKNILAKVSAIVSATLRTARPLEEAASRADARIRALIAAYEVIAAHRWKPVPVRDLLAAVLAPGDDEAIPMRGEAARLEPRVCFTLSSVVCELVMNARQYGALSSRSGRVSVRWRTRGAKLILLWHECGGPPSRSPTAPGSAWLRFGGFRPTRPMASRG